MFDAFHFMTPAYLYLLIPTFIAVAWLLYLQNSSFIWEKRIDKRFLKYLLDDSKKRFVKTPYYLALLVSLMVVALAGPAYKIKPNIESNEQSEVVWVLKVTPSMMTKDLLPSRIKRAVFKIDDFLSLRSDIRSALVAYAGSAHLVMPLTKDKKIINAFVSSLEPSMMPKRGEALYDAVKLATKQFMEVKGSIIVLCDGVSEDALQKIEEDQSLEGYNIIYYNITSEAMRSEGMNSAIQLSIDKSDIEALSNAVDYQFDNALAAKAGRYENSGYALLPFMLVLMLLFFQRGFMGELWRRK